MSQEATDTKTFVFTDLWVQAWRFELMLPNEGLPSQWDIHPSLEQCLPFTPSAILCIDGTTLFVRRRAWSLNRGGVRRWSRTLPGELLDRTI